MAHGGNIFEIQRNCNIHKDDLLDYSANINPLGLPGSLKAMILHSIEDLQHYPDIHYEELKTAISQYYCIDKKDIFVGNGAAQIIFDTINALNPKKTMILAPTFSEYERALKVSGSVIIEHLLKEEENFAVNVEELLKVMDESIDLMVLCNPNNPTSSLLKAEEIRMILEKAVEKNICLMMDEAFMDFVDEEQQYSMLQYYKEYDNLVIVRAFTKFYGIPGLRLGFGLCSNKNLKEKISKRTIPWSLNTFAGYFGKVLLTENSYVEKTHTWLKNEKERFVEKLKEIDGLKIFPPSVNFILIKILKPGFDVLQLQEKLLEKNVLIRNCSNFGNLDKSFFRIAIKNSVDNDKFLEALREAMNK
ncbi:threonine-phosphate decarboxylase CobD [Clostridium formicaceticum]|uniref:threonine-phosphate decarboxylase n=1 Tax=Clostridium formicaceticum TaxID=1497 RepID=A0AAC9RIM3_9CLOT|nr:threonine-phosphate decarboxylase CobD [Clostridium formicaceticum]AOY76350.1 threonine-phosphate decarboxylase [Clostridium formicaceticum]ARE86741.1 Threonine-phosphate decarboxylase [Clostridium formicaceticum]